MIKAYIIEDEPRAIGLLRHYIAKIHNLTLSGHTRDPMEAYAFLQENEVDVLFLDIQLPNISGMEFYKSLHRPPPVVFITAYSEFAVEAFEQEAIDYLVKPLTFPRFLKTWNKIAKIRTDEHLNNLASKSLPTEVVYIKSGAKSYKILWRDISYLKKDENYVAYFDVNGNKYLSRQTLLDIESIFPDYIVRIHKSYAVSVLHIDHFDRRNLVVMGTKLPIGETFRKKFLDKVDARK